MGQIQEITVEPAASELTVNPLFLPTIKVERSTPWIPAVVPICAAFLPSEYEGLLVPLLLPSPFSHIVTGAMWWCH